MMRSLWTAASGMTAQQMNVDVISHNLANVSTIGYKKERLEFKSLLYQTLQRADKDAANVSGKPVNLQVGLGVRPSATSRIFDTGNLESTGHSLDFAVEGKGFFSIESSEGEVSYTRDGAFKLAIGEEGNLLVTSDGYPVLDSAGERITIPSNLTMEDFVISDEGKFYYTDSDGVQSNLDFQLGLYQFANNQGLESIGRNLFKETVASGAPLNETDGETTHKSRIIHKYIEMSNVAVASEMVSLIVAQRAYELNSKAITTSDEMLQQANNLKR